MLTKKNIKVLAKKCSGCECCAYICPVKAISLVPDAGGFLYPHIDDHLCIGCGACYSFCPQTINKNVGPDAKAFYGFSKWEKASSCASGGVASYLSDLFIEKGGYVCGCAFDERFVARFFVVHAVDEIEKFKSSKYLQSSIGDCYLEMKELLKNGEKVLFIGTPCQVAGVRSFLSEYSTNLFTIDLICHGVPSPALFKYYKEYLERKYKSNLTSFNFRYKEKGVWRKYFRYSFSNGKRITIEMEFDKYGRDYLRRSNYRESCYDCKYSSILGRPGDLTIGDFWGIQPGDDGFSFDGNSCVIVNSSKGQAFIEKVEKRLLFSVTKEMVLKNQDALNGPSIRTEERDSYYSSFDRFFFDRKKPPRRRIKDFLRRLMPKKMKAIIKKVLRIK